MKTWFHWLLALGMLLTGSLNTISTKWADTMDSKGVDGVKRPFNHPFVQAIGMFLGEFSCLIVFGLLNLRARYTNGVTMDKAKKFNPLLLALPACCDMTATSLMYLGLTLTYASVFQMLRGSVVIFTGLFSVWFLGRRLYMYHWLSMGLVFVGTVLVGTSNFVCKSDDNQQKATNQTIGNIIIILAQIVVAVQMVVEERFIGGFNIPALQVVGLEGMWGAIILSILVAIMYYIPQPEFMCTAGTECKHFENAPDAAAQLHNNGLLLLAVLLNMASIAFFNFFGISVTKHLNASTRMVLDSVRTVVIWGFSLIVQWQAFCWMQVLGFLILLAGTIFYNRIIEIPYLPYPSQEEEDAETQRMKDLHSNAFNGSIQGDGAEEALLGDDGALAPALEGEEGADMVTTVTADSPALNQRGMEEIQTPTMGRASMLKSK